MNDFTEGFRYRHGKERHDDIKIEAGETPDHDSRIVSITDSLELKRQRQTRVEDRVDHSLCD